MRNYTVLDNAKEKNLRLIRNRRLQIRRRFIGIILFCVSVMITACIFSVKASAVSDDVETYYKYYTSIEIGWGDTLSSIEHKYNNTSICSQDDYIDEVMFINGLMDDSIKFGNYLIVPYYSTEYK